MYNIVEEWKTNKISKQKTILCSVKTSIKEKNKVENSKYDLLRHAGIIKRS